MPMLLSFDQLGGFTRALLTVYTTFLYQTERLSNALVRTIHVLKLSVRRSRCGDVRVTQSFRGSEDRDER